MRRCQWAGQGPDTCVAASPVLWCRRRPSPGTHPRALWRPAPNRGEPAAPAVEATPAGGFRLLHLTPAALGPEMRAFLGIVHPRVPPTGWLSLEAAAAAAAEAAFVGPAVPVLQLTLCPSAVRARCRAIEAGWGAPLAPGGGPLAGEAPPLRTADGGLCHLVPALAAEEGALRAIARATTGEGEEREGRRPGPCLIQLHWREEGVRASRRSGGEAPRVPFLARVGERGSLFLAVTEAVADGDWAKALASRYLTALCVPAAEARCPRRQRLTPSVGVHPAGSGRAARGRAASALHGRGSMRRCGGGRRRRVCSP